ncbi:MAG: aminotransferase class III-fold pyridoxal phosphate-dependent enzyme [Chloroflexi bacterium]|nr:aminotransferase class III-fold pyridoxal phosphate-dependent enzyme [Chloroflexota bacterium]
METRTAKMGSIAMGANRVIPGVSQTFSKNPNQFVRGVSPAFIERGSGGRVWDVDGNEFIDFPMSLLPVVLGHNDPDVTAAVQSQITEGTIYSLPHPLEIEVSEMLIEEIPCAEMVRFGKSGTDSTTAAIRVARGFTRRDRVAICGYHGWADWYIGTTTRDLGVPAAVSALSHTFEYNNPGSLKALFNRFPGEFAAVIMEPTGVVAPEEGFLVDVADLTREHGALLVFDEIITGFRVSLGGAQTYFGVTPDLAAFGKGMANGYPISAVVGRADVMKVFDEVFYSGTFAGETVSLAAAKATINKMRREPVIDRLWKTGRRLQDGYNAIAGEVGLAANTACLGLPPHTVATFTDDAGEDSIVLRSLLQQELARRGILYLVGFNICYAHSDEDVEITLRALRESMQVVADAKNENRIEEALEGPAAEPVFRRA